MQTYSAQIEAGLEDNRTATELGDSSQPRDENSQWWNLTEAIASGADIDYERLDWRKAKCVHPEMGTLTHKLMRYEDLDGLVLDKEDPDAWDCSGDDIWKVALTESWLGNGGWSLWVAGKNPLKPATEYH